MFFYIYLAHNCLHDSIKSTLRSISISRHLLFLHFLSEAFHLLRQRQHVFESKLSLALQMNPVFIEWVKGEWKISHGEQSIQLLNITGQTFEY